MGRRQFAFITLCSLACIVYTNYNASAGWFGPSNYDECVLDKTSDRMLSNYQVFTIQEACRELFPLKPVQLKESLIDDSGKTIQYRNCSAPTGEFKICVTRIPDSYIINRVVGHFAITDQCTYISEEPTEEYIERARTNHVGNAFSFSPDMCESFGGTFCINYHEYKRRYDDNLSTFRNVVGSKAWFNDTYSFNIERSFNCSYFSFYGIAKSK
jgi:hypothetical protein